MHGSMPADNFSRFPTGMVNMPDQIPVFPLTRVVLLPGEVLPLHIFEPRYRALVRDALNSHRIIGMIEHAAGHETSTQELPPLRNIGCVGLIADHRELSDGRYLIWLLGLERFTTMAEVPVATLYRQFRVTYPPNQESADALAGLQPVRNELQRVLPRLLEVGATDRSMLEKQLVGINDSQLIALACQILELPGSRKRQILEADNQIDRFMLVVEDLYRHLDGISDSIIDSSETLN